MCSVSAVSDYYRDRTLPHGWEPIPARANPFVQPYLPPVQQWDQEAKQLLREVLERLDKLDKRLGDIECHDESKAELRKQLGLS